jgi:beta-phosphoglucomutase
MMPYSGIIFDFNGVLFWDSALHEQAWRDFTVQVRGYPFTAEEMTHYVLGRPNAFILEYVFGRQLAADEIHRRTQEKEARYRQLCLALGADFKLSPGAVELFDFLVAHDIPHTIATASEQVNVNFFCAHLRLAQWFEPAKIVLDDGLLPNKPEPDIYLKAAEKIGLAPAECMVVEDSVSGICAARRAGIGKIYALGPPAKHAELAAVEGVNAVITQLGEIPTELFKF